MGWESNPAEPLRQKTTMQSEQINQLFRQINALQLLREHNAPLILSFLRIVFTAERNSIGQDELIPRLADYLQQFDEQDVFDETEIDTTDLFSRYRNKAKALLRDWEGINKRYLRGDNNAEGQYEYSVTEHVVRAWQWLEGLDAREFTGTQSRFDDIFEKLKRILENSREKTDSERIADLRQKQLDIEAEIAAIQAGKSLYRPFDNTRLREEYDGLLEQVRALATDFKSVEGNFERIRMSLLRQYAAQEGSKGAMLSAALDARDELDRTRQGQSFNHFFEALRDAQRTRQFEDGVKLLLEIMKERNIPFTNENLLLRLYRHLLHEAQPVLDANRRIADRITRIVAENASHNRQLLRRRLAEVKQLLLQPAFNEAPAAKDQPCWELDSPEADIRLPLEKTIKLQAAEQKVAFQLPQKNTDTKPDIPLSDDLSITFRLENQITEALASEEQTTLVMLTKQFPMQAGLAELLAYLNIAARNSNRHFFDPAEADLVVLDAEKRQFADGPRVFFVKT
jgi:hypothetical protein